jgi:hypothetical protein
MDSLPKETEKAKKKTKLMKEKKKVFLGPSS